MGSQSTRWPQHPCGHLTGDGSQSRPPLDFLLPMEVNVDFQCDLGVRPDSWPFGDGTEKSNGTVEKKL